MSRCDIVVVGASAGGVESLMRLVGALPAGFPAAVFVVLHVPPELPSALPAILSRSGTLPAAHAQDGHPIVPGTITVAPPNLHLYVRRGYVHVAAGPRENGMRPSVDTLFRSAARAYGSRVAGVVLTGALSDGAVGLAAIKLRGGVAVVQDPEEAPFPSMPTSALAATDVDFCAPVLSIASYLVELAREPMHVPEPTSGQNGAGDADPRPDDDTGKPLGPLPVPDKGPSLASGLTCPECYGSIWELRDGDSVRFECRVGHAYVPEAFVAEQGERVEAALWTAINTLQERAETFRRLAALYRGTSAAAIRYQERAVQTSKHAETLRALLYSLVQDGDVG